MFQRHLLCCTGLGKFLKYEEVPVPVVTRPLGNCRSGLFPIFEVQKVPVTVPSSSSFSIRRGQAFKARMRKTHVHQPQSMPMKLAGHNKYNFAKKVLVIVSLNQG